MWLFNPILIFQGHTKLLRLQMKATAFACFGLDQRNMKGFLSLPSDIVYLYHIENTALETQLTYSDYTNTFIIY